ncbi:MAG: hypothetical protein HZC17_05430 [Candidatus Omnitrophica bacterium]|nr:hypothetical protein [Candidatus Omnitrophota bacterium]
MIEMRYFCPLCETRNRIFLPLKEDALCLNCNGLVLKPSAISEPFKCVLCDYNQFYLTKDFNRGIGLAIFIAGAIASFWTYGISLAVAAVIDALLYKRLAFLKVCYICDTEYKNLPIRKEDKVYDHVIGDLIRSMKEDWHLAKKKLWTQKSA